MDTPTILKQCCGVDMSKAKFDACLSVLTLELTVKLVAKRQFNNTPAGIEKFCVWLKKWGREKVSLTINMEATGVYHEALAWHLYGQDYQISIMLPTKGKHFLKAMGYDSKNDQIDAQGLAQIGLQQSLRLWQPCSKIFRQLRCLAREHEDLQQEKTTVGNRLHALSYQHDLPKTTKKRLEKQRTLLNGQVKSVHKEIEHTLKKDPTLWKRVECLLSIPSVGLLTVATILAETDGFSMIGSAAQLTSYAGYDVLERQSGASKGKTRISKKGNAHIRRILHFPALNTVRFGDDFFKNFSERLLEKGKTKMQVFVAIQRKLLILMWTLWKKQEHFQANFYQDRQQKKQEMNTDYQELKQKESRNKQQDGSSKNLPSNHEQRFSFGLTQKQENVKSKEEFLPPTQDELTHANKCNKLSFG